MCSDPPPIRSVLAATVLAASLLAPAAAHGAASPWSRNPQSSVRLITPYSVAPRNGELRLGIHFKLSPGWHVYWKNSGDAGFPPVVGVTGGPGLGKAELLWPAPRRFDLPGNLEAFGYEQEVVYPVRASVEPAAGDRLRLVADVDYLTCAVDCVPYRYTLTVEQPLAENGVADPETAPLVDRFWHRLPEAADRFAGVATDGAIDASLPGGPVLSVRVRGVHADPAQADLFLEPIADLEAGRPVASAGADGLTFRVPLHPKQVSWKPPAELGLSWTVTGLRRDGEPWSLEARRQVPIGTANVQIPRRGLDLGSLFRALVAGLVWAFTPGALALLLGGVASRGTTNPSRRALACAGGILVGCWVAALLGHPGTASGGMLGAVDPHWAALAAAVSVLVALDFWGLFRSPAAPVEAGAPQRAATGIFGSMLAGGLTALLALAWTASPFALSFHPVEANGPAAPFAALTAIACGLALPTLLAARLLPSRLRELLSTAAARGALGFLAFAGAAWPLYRLAHEVSPESLAWIELALLGLALFAWLGSRSQAQGALKFVRALGVAALLLATWWLVDRGRLTAGGSGEVVAPATGIAPAPGPAPHPQSPST